MNKDLNKKIPNDEIDTYEYCLSGGMRSGGKTLMQKGLLYEKLTEELGCPLEVVFKAMKENISFQREDIITKEVYILEGFDSYIVYNKGRKIYELHTTFKVGRGNWIADLDLKNYGKTWFLEGEKNETL